MDAVDTPITQQAKIITGAFEQPRKTPISRREADAMGALETRKVGVDAKSVTFDRCELQTILNLYGRRVAEGEWRDYAIDFSPQRAVFAIFRRAAEHPLFTIEKNPALSRKQGAYAVIAHSGLILKRGHDLARVLQALEKGLRLVK